MSPSRKQWTFAPHSGGSKIPPDLQLSTHARIERYAEQHYAGLYTRIDVRFRGALCYIDAFTEPAQPSRDQLRSLGESIEGYLARLRETPTRLCRLRYFAGHLARLRETPTRLCRLRYFAGRDLWSVALYSYSSERFEPCILPTGEYCGNPEECFALGASFYLTREAA